jgi:uncharacterized Rossmann fold enzyme
MENKPKQKIAFYDFQVSPFSFDFAQFVLCARAAQCDKIVLVPGERAYQKCTPGEQDYRLHNLILGLAPDSHLCVDREEAKAWWHEGCFPEGYTVEKPIASHTVGHVIRAMQIFPFMPTQEKKDELAADGLFGPNLVTITIRDCSIKPLRNSSIEEWIKAADWMREQGFDVVFIPDTDKPDAVFGNHRSVPKAALDVQYRLALYEAAALNAGVNNGPLALCFYSRRPLLYFRALNNAFPETSMAGWSSAGVPYRTQPPWFTPLQRIIWDGGDDFDNIKENLELWMKARQGDVEAWPPSIAPTFPIKGVQGKETRHQQMSTAMAKAKENGWPMMKRIPAHEKAISLVCYGPSLKKTWRFIPRPIMTVSGAHDFLIERGVIPDFHVDCDPREHKARMLKYPHKDVKYLMASVCHPTFWDKLQGHDLKLWHLHNGPETDEWLKENDPTTAPLGGGTTVGSRAFQVASLLGYERFHIFGMDCSYEDDKRRHAGEHLGKDQRAIEVICGNRNFTSSPQMVEAARETLVMIQNYEIWMYFHGDGLQQEMVRNFQSRFGVIAEKHERFIHPPAMPMKEVAHG